MNSASPPDLRQIFWSGFAPKCLESEPLPEASPMAKRVAFYLRVSTGGWAADDREPAPGARRDRSARLLGGGRDLRRRDQRHQGPQAATGFRPDAESGRAPQIRHDRRLVGRSLQDLVAFLGELRAAGVDIFVHQQALDTSTPWAGLSSNVGRLCGIRGGDDPRADTRRDLRGLGRRESGSTGRQLSKG
jgi:hypothetical protein